MSGFPGDLSPEQEQALEDLHNSTDTRDMTEADCLRFLRARAFKVDATATMIEADFEWRDEAHPEAASLDDPGVKTELTSGKYKLIGADFENHPTFVYRSAMHYSNLSPTDHVLRTLVYIMENMIKTHMAEYHVERFNVIFDMTNYGFANMDNSFTTAMITMLQDHYPERLNRAYVLNAPWMFKFVWAAIKPFMDASTKAKVVMMSAEYEAEFLERLPPESLPVFWGGTIEGIYDDEAIDHLEMFSFAPPPPPPEELPAYEAVEGKGMEGFAAAAPSAPPPDADVGVGVESGDYVVDEYALGHSMRGESGASVSASTSTPPAEATPTAAAGVRGESVGEGKRKGKKKRKVEAGVGGGVGSSGLSAVQSHVSDEENVDPTDKHAMTATATAVPPTATTATETERERSRKRKGKHAASGSELAPYEAVAVKRVDEHVDSSGAVRTRGRADKHASGRTNGSIATSTMSRREPQSDTWSSTSDGEAERLAAVRQRMGTSIIYDVSSDSSSDGEFVSASEG